MKRFWFGKKPTKARDSEKSRKNRRFGRGPEAGAARARAAGPGEEGHGQRAKGPRLGGGGVGVG